MPNFVDLMAATAASEMSRHTPTDFVYGTVISASPLVIQPDEKAQLPAGFFILSALCRPFTTTVLAHRHKADGGAGDDTDQQLLTVTLWRGIAQGDRVRMLQCRGGQKYYVLDREGSL